MSSTNAEEKKRLHQICSDLHNDKLESEIISRQDSTASTYYVDRADSNLFKDSISEYDFDTPVDFKKLAQDMWTYQRNDYMTDFLQVITVATFNNQVDDEGQDDEGIPSFIYNF